MTSNPLLKYGVKSDFERELLDNALTVGMSVEEFWYGDPELYFNYARVYENKVKVNQQYIWQIGARFCQALESSVLFPAGVIDKNVINNMPKYPECPFTEEEVEEELSEKEKEFYRKKAIVHFANWVNGFNKIKGGGENGSE